MYWVTLLRFSLVLRWFFVQRALVKRLIALIAIFPILAVAEPQWVKVWEGDMVANAGQGPVHVIEEADTGTHKHTGGTARVVVRTNMKLGSVNIVGMEIDTFDCVHATYTIQSGKAGPGPTIPVKLPAELAMYQFACN
ncbi:MAG TPA: hypothetical protein VGJ20_37450 [Xanthobacteraceae bacterium]